MGLKLCFCLVSLFLLSGFRQTAAQEVLLPLQHGISRVCAFKQLGGQAIVLPLFDDFADGRIDADLWDPRGGVTVSMDVSPLAPTVGVATLDALDADGNLYSHASTDLFMADTLLSLPVRLDSLTPADSVLFSFYYQKVLQSDCINV